MSGWLRDIYSGAHDDVQLSDREILRVAPRNFWQGENDLPTRFDSRAVNFQTILETGHMPQVEGLSQGQYIDWSSEDAFTHAITQVRDNTMKRVENDQALQDLLGKESWTRDDRIVWERSVSSIVNDEHLKIPGLSEYRNVSEMVSVPVSIMRWMSLLKMQVFMK